MRTRLFKSILAVILVFAILTVFGSILAGTVSAVDTVDGYVWQEINRDVKTGVMLGSAVATNWFMGFLDGNTVDMDFQTARNVTYIMDDMYEEHFPLHYSIMDVIMESGDIDF